MSLLNPVVTCGYVNIVRYVVNNGFFSAHGLLSTCILAMFFLLFLCFLCICASVWCHLVVKAASISASVAACLYCRLLVQLCIV